MNLTIGEFAAIGDTVKEFAASDATVIIGSALDPSMKDEVRVTVVATGLGKTSSNSQKSPMRIIKKEAMMNDDNKVKHTNAAFPFMTMPTHYRI